MMAVPILEELFADIPRLLAAGSSAVRGDARLRRHARSLRALADSVPALGPLADAVEQVCRAPAEKAATAWLPLLVLLRHVTCPGVGG